MTNKDAVMSMMSYKLGDDLNFNATNADNSSYTKTDLLYRPHMSSWDYYQNYYYPFVIKESYPVYLQERSQDKGKQAFEIIKVLKDKKLVNLSKVENFIDLMDELIKIL